MNLLLMAHVALGLLILVFALVAIVKYLIGWLGKGQFKGMDRGLMSGFSGLMDLQATVGILLLLWVALAGEGLPLSGILHGVIMIAAAVVAHLPARWKNADDVTRFRNNLFTIVAALIVVFIGISVISMA